MATTDTELQQLVINVGTEAQIEAGIASGTITSDMLSIATDGADITYDWVGTLAEYNEQNVATNHPDWLCFITDDVNNSGEDVYNNVYSKTVADEIFVAKTDNLPQYLPNLLEYKYTDHLLNNVSWLRANTFSWQSGEIYEAAYEHLMEDMLNATQKSIYLKHNVALIGDATVSNRGLLSGFRTTVSYAQVSGLYTPTTSLEMLVKVIVPTTISNSTIWYATTDCEGVVMRITSATNMNIWLSSNNTSWNICSGLVNTFDFTPGTARWIKLVWDGANYVVSMSKDGISYTVTSTTASSLAVAFNKSGTICLGGCSYTAYPFAYGTIDLSESYVKIDGTYAWKGANSLTYYEAEDGHKICLPDQENNVDYLYNKGDGWYYIYDAENNRFKLPRNKHRKVVESGVERGVWYRLYDDGWVEQGGDFKTFAAAWTSTIVGLAVEMASNDYYASPITGHTSYTDSPCIYEKRPTYFRCTPYNTNYEGRWYVCGQSAVKPRTRGGEDYLYFYVGEFTQDAITNIAGVTTETLNSKLNRGEHEVIEFQAPTAANNYTWYRKYADGWVEQGGRVDGTPGSGMTKNVTFPIPMLTITSITGYPSKNYGNYNESWAVIGITDSTGMSIALNAINSNGSVQHSYTGSSVCYWEVKGMTAV